MYYLTDFCSLCLESNKNLTAHFSMNLNVREIIEYVIPEFILQRSEIPIQVCDKCLNNIDNFYKFRKNCLENVVSFGEYVQKLIQIHGPYKYLSVKQNEISRRKKGEIHIETHKNVENTVQVPAPEVEVVMREETPAVVEHNNSKTENENIEQVLIKVETPEDNMYMEEEINGELMLKDDINFSDDMQDIQEIPASSDLMNNDLLDDEDISEEARMATFDSLPLRSKEKYEMEFRCFDKWRKSKNVHGVDEGILLEFFYGLGSTYKASSLWTKFSMLKCILKVYENKDISRYMKLRAYLKGKNRNYKPKQSKTLEKEHIVRFLNEAPDDKYLMMKVVLVIAVSGACGREELARLTIDDIEDKGSHLLITLIDTKTFKVRRFTVSNDEYSVNVNVLDFYKKYLSLRPQNVGHRRFFLNYRDEKCTIQPVGKNMLSRVPKEVAIFLNLPQPEVYTGHSFRRANHNIAKQRENCSLLKESL